MGSNSAPSSGYRYDAFLSFRGDDVRNEFADLVHNELERAGLRTFLDEKDVNKGEEFDTVITTAINESKMAVFILSENFASSTYCLEEVSLFMALRKAKKAEVLPVFYKVDPDPEWAEGDGCYSKFFKKHEEDLKRRFGIEEEDGEGDVEGEINNVKEELAKKRRKCACFSFLRSWWWKEDVGEEEEEEDGGCYSKFFKEHEQDMESRFRREEERLAKEKREMDDEYKKKKSQLDDWKKDLAQVAKITGYHREGGEATRVSEITGDLHVYHVKDKVHVTDFINKVVQDACRLANPLVLDVLRPGIGRVERFSEVETWVRDKDHQKCIALLHGRKGIGKTTTAAVVSDNNYREFDAVVFLDKVEEECKQAGGIVKLQGKIYKKISNRSMDHVGNCLEGRGWIKKALYGKRVLIVLDDLDQGQHLSELIGEPKSIGGQVKLIVTSGNENLLTDAVCEKFHIGPLTKQQSLKLLKWEAEKRDPPVVIDEVDTWVDDALEYCAWNPCHIKAFAQTSSFFINKKKEALLKDLNRSYLISMKPVFGAMEEDDKRLFFDIACFYAGRDYDHVKSALDHCDHEMYQVDGFERLRSMHWVSVGDDKTVTMDRPVRAMGQYMVREEARENLAKQSHIWSPKDAILLLQGLKGTYRTRSFILDGERVETPTTMEFKTHALVGMTKLELLQLVSVKLGEDYEHFPKELVWLSWEGMPAHRMLTDNSSKSLASLDWHNPGLHKFLNECRSLDKLKILNLSRCHSINKTPDFKRLRVPNLESLILEDCIFLKEIDSSIEELKKLVQLNLRGCGSLEYLPMLGPSVKLLDISKCTALRVKPNTRIESVEELRADHIEVDQLWAEAADLSFSEVFPSLVVLSLVDGGEQSVGTITSDLKTLASFKHLVVHKDRYTAFSEAVGPSFSVSLGS